MSHHAKRVRSQVRTARFLLRPVLSSKLPLRTKLGIFKLYIRSRLTYAAPAWYCLLSAEHRNNLRAQQALTLRTIVGAPYFVRNDIIERDTRTEHLESYIRRLTSNMFSRVDASKHQHLRSLAPLHTRPPEGRPYARELCRERDSTRV